jgi:hypothetical protein
MKTKYIGSVKLGYYSPGAGFRHLEVSTKSAKIDDIISAIRAAGYSANVDLRIESTGKYTVFGATVLFASVIVDSGLQMNDVEKFKKELKNNGLRLAN